MGREIVRSDTSELFGLVLESQESDFIRKQADGFDDKSRSRSEPPHHYSATKTQQETREEKESGFAVEEKAEGFDDEAVQTWSEPQLRSGAAAQMMIQKRKSEKDCTVPLAPGEDSEDTPQPTQPFRRPPTSWQNSNQHSGKSLDSALMKDIFKQSGNLGYQTDTNSLQQVPQLALRRAQEDEHQPGAFRGAPGQLQMRTEKISFALVGVTTSLIAEREDQARYEDDDIESPPSGHSISTDLEPSQPLSGNPVVARLVTGQSQRLLPRAKEAKMDSPPSGRTKRTTILLCVVFLFTASAITVILCVLLLLPTSNTPELNPTTNHTTTEMPDKTSPPMMVNLMDLLPDYTLSTLTRPNSPQARAFRWMLDDPYMTTYSSERLVQRFALVTLYFATNGKRWFNNTNWLSYEYSECLWFATDVPNQEDPGFSKQLIVPPAENVTEFPCGDEQQESYTHLWLQNNNLQGQFPPEMYLLTSLKTLVLNINDLGGSTISSHIGRLTSLEVLATASAGISGTIPTEFGLLSNMSDLLLTSNSIHGTIPAEFGLLAKSEAILLDFNRLTGTIPSELGSLGSLEYIFLFDNWLTGTVPSEMGHAPSLFDVGLEFNMLTGPIPSEFGASTTLHYLSVYENLLTGTLPSLLGKVETLVLLYADANLISGPVPSELGLPTPLTELILRQNQITGLIPSELGLLPNLDTLSLGNNLMSGTIPQEFNQSFILVDLAENMFTGTLPAQLCNAGTDDCPYVLIECTFMFDCSDMLCGCDCPCEEELNRVNASSNFNATW